MKFFKLSTKKKWNACFFRFFKLAKNEIHVFWSFLSFQKLNSSANFTMQDFHLGSNFTMEEKIQYVFSWYVISDILIREFGVQTEPLPVFDYTICQKLTFFQKFFSQFFFFFRAFQFQSFLQKSVLHMMRKVFIWKKPNIYLIERIKNYFHITSTTASNFNQSKISCIFWEVQTF